MRIPGLTVWGCLGLTSLSGCALRTKILDVAAVSMTRQQIKEGETLKDKGSVSGQFCADSFRDKNPIGLIDEVVRQTQKDRNVDYITHAVFYTDGRGCITMSGTGYVVTQAVPPRPTAPVPGLKKVKRKRGSSRS